MKKTILAGLTALILSPSALADPFKGFYIGGALGGQHNKITANNNNPSPISSVLLVGPTSNVPAFGFYGGLASSSTGNLYLAGEIGVDFSIKRVITTVTPYLAGKLGYQLAERFIAYIGFGGNFNYFALKSATSGNIHKKSFGYEALAGVALAITNRIVTGIEYKFRDSGRVTINSAGSANNYRFYESLIMARLSYKL